MSKLKREPNVTPGNFGSELIYRGAEKYGARFCFTDLKEHAAVTVIPVGDGPGSGHASVDIEALLAFAHFVEGLRARGITS